MTRVPLLLLALCAALFHLASAQFQGRVVSQWRTEEIYDGVGDTLIDDCSTAQGDVIRRAVVDAFFLAGGARDAFSGNGLLPGGARFFDRVFRDQQGPFSRTYVQENFDRVARQNGGFPQEILFHCGDGWIEAVRRRATAFNREIEPTRCGPVEGTEGVVYAFTFHIRSGDFPSSDDPTNSLFGPDSAFRSAVHITVCSDFFSFPQLSAIDPVNEGSRLSNRARNQAAIMLHEFMHALSPRIRDGGYGLQGIIDVAEGRPARDNVNALYNADTYAYFAMVVSPVQGMRDWDWTDGSAVRPT